MLLLLPETRKTIPTMIAGDHHDDDAVADLLAALLALSLGGQPGLPGRALAGSLVAGHGPRPYPIRGLGSGSPTGVGQGSERRVAGPAGDQSACAVCSLVRMPLVVQKFGGTSVGDADRIRAVADHIAGTRRQGSQVVAVVSAMGKTTDDLIHLANYGQRRSSRPASTTCSSAPGSGSPWRCWSWPWPTSASTPSSFTGSQVGIITDDDHTRAKIREVRGDRLREALAAGQGPGRGGLPGASPTGPRRSPRSAGRVRCHRGGVGRSPRTPMSARSTPTGLGRSLRLPPDRARGAPDQPDLLRGDARDGGHGRAGS